MRTVVVFLRTVGFFSYLYWTRRAYGMLSIGQLWKVAGGAAEWNTP